MLELRLTSCNSASDLLVLLYCKTCQFVLQSVGGSEWVPSQLVLGGVRIGMGCMNLVTGIRGYP